jgi:shikimate dehydrogenase
VIYNLALLGHPVAHSLSPALHQGFLQEAGLKGGYLCFDVPPDKLTEQIKHLQALGFRGCNLTIPHKKAGLQIAGQVDEEAEQIGATNTLIFQNNQIRAANTDWLGFKNSLPKRNFQKVILIGAGGSANAVIMALKKLAVPELHLWVRDSSSSRQNAQNLKNLFEYNQPGAQCQIAFLDDLPLLPDPDLIINSTPLGMEGMHEDKSPLSEEFLKQIANPDCFFYDLVYNPAQTKLLSEAAKLGFKTQNGFAMLEGQAAEAFKLWTGFSPSLGKVI